VKPFLLTALLDGGHLRVTGEHRCKGKLRIEGRTLDCAHAPQASPLLGSEALALSCNEFFTHYASRLLVGSFATTLSQAGFSGRQPFGEACAPASVESPTDLPSHLLQCLGESHVLTTPLALLDAFRILVAKVHTRSGLASSIMLREGMAGCVRYGTGAGAQVDGLAIGGKTGTANAPGGGHLNGLFLSYAPVDSPRVVMVSFVELGSGGGEAAPVAARLWQTLGDAGVFG
jgi:cell division protein FtsI/penicillin-binding protein 2